MRPDQAEDEKLRTPADARDHYRASQRERLSPSGVVPCSACWGVLKRTEHPEYFNGFTSEGGACWTSSKAETLRVDSKEIARIIEKIAASPWLRTMEGIRWEYLPNDPVELPPNGGSESKKGVVGG
jgi:hypothetical protein